MAEETADTEAFAGGISGFGVDRVRAEDETETDGEEVVDVCPFRDLDFTGIVEEGTDEDVDNDADEVEDTETTFVSIDFPEPFDGTGSCYGQQEKERKEEEQPDILTNAY